MLHTACAKTEYSFTSNHLTWNMNSDSEVMVKVISPGADSRSQHHADVTLLSKILTIYLLWNFKIGWMSFAHLSLTADTSWKLLLLFRSDGEIKAPLKKEPNWKKLKMLALWCRQRSLCHRSFTTLRTNQPALTSGTLPSRYSSYQECSFITCRARMLLWLELVD